MLLCIRWWCLVLAFTILNYHKACESSKMGNTLMAYFSLHRIHFYSVWLQYEKTQQKLKIKLSMVFLDYLTKSGPRSGSFLIQYFFSYFGFSPYTLTCVSQFCQWSAGTCKNVQCFWFKVQFWWYQKPWRP